MSIQKAGSHSKKKRTIKTWLWNLRYLSGVIICRGIKKKSLHKWCSSIWCPRFDCDSVYIVVYLTKMANVSWIANFVPTHTYIHTYIHTYMYIHMVRAFGMNPKVGDSSPPQAEIFSVSKTLTLHKNIRSCVENECYCPRTVNNSNVNFTSKIYTNIHTYVRTYVCACVRACVRRRVHDTSFF